MKPLLLVVDDCDDFRATLTYSLHQEGYRVVSAENGKVALDMLKAGLKVDAVLLDRSMPVMDGTAFLEAALPLLAGTPVLVISSDPGADLGKHRSLDDLLACVTARLAA
jgi:CheY-like chemotaxis protein